LVGRLFAIERTRKQHSLGESDFFPLSQKLKIEN
jgi:hypothetical protein